MNYKFMIDTAIDVIRKRYDKRHNPLPGDTVCVICAGNGNVYTASNEYVVKDNVSENVHAEINALKKMQADGLTKIKAVTVFNSCTITPILPCNGCITFITSLNPENSHALIVTPNGNIPITEVSRYAAPDRSQSRVASSYYSVYTSLPASNRGASLYTGPSGQPYSQTSRSITSNQPVYYRRSQPNGNMSAMSGLVGVSYSSRTANTAIAGKGPVRANQNGVNNLLKNKLSTLFEDDDAEESKNL